jgi:hypothetical protein
MGTPSVRTVGSDARPTTVAPTAGRVTPNVGVKTTPNAEPDDPNARTAANAVTVDPKATTVAPNAATAPDARTFNPNVTIVPNAEPPAPDGKRVPPDAGVSTPPDRQNH